MNISRSHWILRVSIAVLCLLAASTSDAGFMFNVATPGPGAVLEFNLTGREVALAQTGARGSLANMPTTSYILGSNILRPEGIVQNADPTGTGGDELIGIFDVTSIRDQITGQTYWQEGVGQHLVGEYWGLTALTLPSTTTPELFTGGSMQVFFDPSSSISPVVNLGTGPFSAGWTGINTAVNNANPSTGGNGVGVAGQTSVLSLAGTQGIVNPNPSGPEITLSATIQTLTAGTAIGGTGNGFFSVTSNNLFPIVPDGVDPTHVLPNTPGTQDLYFQDDFNTSFSGIGGNVQNHTGWSLRNNDPANAVLAPEPASALVWFLLGSAGYVPFGRSKRRNQS